MLPDYPTLKKEITEVLDVLFRKRIEHYTIAVKEIPKTKIFEGGRGIIKRNTGEEDHIELMSSETSFELKYDDIPSMTSDQLLSKLDAAAFDMAKKMETGFFKSMSKQLDKAGRNFSEKNHSLTGRTILHAIRNILIPFDKYGNAKYPSIFIGSQLEDRMAKAFKEIDDTPELKKEFDEIMQIKKDKWRAEESSRKLVE